MSAGGDTITYRGRSLEEVLPRIREELGPEAVIERRRSGLVGGFAGFFQREMVEIDARPPVDGELADGAPTSGFDALAGADDDEAALRAATLAPVDDGPLAWEDEREGLEAPAMRRIVEQAAPFAELLRGATAMPPAAPDRPEPFVAEAEPEPEAGADLAPEPSLPVRELPPAAAGHERRLVEHGLAAGRARSVVAETLAHALPFTPSRHLKRTVRATLARRIPVQHSIGGTGRVLALVGAAGSGKTRTAAGLAAGYAKASDREVAALSLRPADGSAELAALLEPHGVPVQPGRDGATLRGLLAERTDDVVAIVDTPAVSPRDPDAIAALATELAAAGVTEAHVVLPATLAAPVAREALAAYAPVRPAALVLTHVDDTDHLGPLVDLAIELDLPLSFVVSGADVTEGIALADPVAIATRLLP